ncbi:MAG: TonB-dependent receptor, partial [Candidatus Solibacter usitatus]|nr:TonB-dependent receptor [Candidatus Solibacter usitatus]
MKFATGVFLLFSIIPAAFAQEGRGTILGRITDTQSAVIANATVQVKNAATGYTATVRTNEAGLYAAPYLTLGKYRISVEAAGFKKSVRDNIEVRVNDRLDIDFTMQVGEVTESISVVAETPLLETNSASTGQVIDTRRVAELPIAHGEPYALMASTTGAAFTGDPALDRPFEPSHIANYAIGGARGLRNELTLDGAPAGASTANAREVSASFVPPIDIVGEMKVLTTAFDASVGQTEGGAVNLVLKSGTNQFHGTGYYNKLAPELNANLFFANKQGQPIAPLEYNRWGVSATGPVSIPKLYNGRNRTFYMYGYEGIIETRTRGGVNTVPTAEQREGDLSGLLRVGGNYQIYDPFTRRAIAGGRLQEDPIAGNIIPKSRISPIATNILKFYALPNTTGTTDGGNNLSQPNLPEQANYYSHTWRLDHNVTSKWRTFGRVNWYNRNSTYSNFFDNVATGEWFWFHSVGGAFDHVYTLSPTTVVNLRYGYNRFIRHVSRDPDGLGFDLTKLGFPKNWNDSIPSDIRRFPYINVNGYYGTNGTVLWRPQDTHEYALAVDKIMGSHSVKVGAQYRKYLKNQINPDISSTGQLVFDTTYTRGPLDNSAASPRGQGLAALLLGVLSNGGGVDRRATFADKNNMWAVHIQDDWKVTRKLTLNLGLRYEVESPLEDRWNRSVRGFDAAAALSITQAAQTAYARSTTPEVPANQFKVQGGLTFAGVNGQPSFVWNRDSNNFMPRIGFAYAWNAKTVIRGGYGIFYTFMGIRRGDVIQSGY